VAARRARRPAAPHRAASDGARVPRLTPPHAPRQINAVFSQNGKPLVGHSMTGRTHTSKCADGAGSRFYFDPKGNLSDPGASPCSHPFFNAAAQAQRQRLAAWCACIVRQTRACSLLRAAPHIEKAGQSG
jgi:hypothetical protein